MGADLNRATIKLGNFLSVAEQIQTFCLGRKTGEVYITNLPPPARINIVEGEIVDAQCGQLSGMDAAIAMINIPESHTEFAVGEKPQRRTINMPYVQLLCEAARIKDEGSGSVAGFLKSSQPIPLSAAAPYFRVTLGAHIKTFPIKKGLSYIGRSEMNEIVIEDPTISQRHASVDYSDKGVYLQDLESTNGTFIAGQAIKERWLSSQDMLQFGGVHCLFVGVAKK